MDNFKQQLQCAIDSLTHGMSEVMSSTDKTKMDVDKDLRQALSFLVNLKNCIATRGAKRITDQKIIYSN